MNTLVKEIYHEISLVYNFVVPEPWKYEGYICNACFEYIQIFIKLVAIGVSLTLTRLDRQMLTIF